MNRETQGDGSLPGRRQPEEGRTSTRDAPAASAERPQLCSHCRPLVPRSPPTPPGAALPGQTGTPGAALSLIPVDGIRQGDHSWYLGELGHGSSPARGWGPAWHRCAVSPGAKDEGDEQKDPVQTPMAGAAGSPRHTGRRRGGA